MKWKIIFVEPEGYLRIVVEGIYHPMPHLQMMKEAMANPYWKPGNSVLLDVRKLDYSETNLTELEQSSHDMLIYNNFIGSAKIAFLTNSIENFHIIRQFELLTEEDVSAWMKVFMDENQALRWLQAYRTVNHNDLLSDRPN